MPQTLLIAVVGFTSVVIYVLAVTRWALPPSLLVPVAQRVVEWFGMSLLFLFANIAVMGLGILTVRSITSWFQSVYVADDEMLAVLSAMQGSALQWWRAAARRSSGAAGRAPIG